MLARVAAGMAFNSAPENRWRRAAVLFAAAVFSLLLLASTSVLLTLQRELERVGERWPARAVEKAPSDLFVLPLDDEWRGDQYPVLWIDPATTAEPVLPPGITKLPQPGQAVVSPALDRLAGTHPQVAQRYPDRLVLSRQGISSGDELFAYVRMPEGRGLAGSETAIRVGRFGSAGDLGFDAFAFSSAPFYAYFEGVGALLIIPGLLVLAVGVAAGSSVRDRRFAVLAWLGARHRTLVTLAALETMLLALPGIVAVAGAWGLVAPRLDLVPLADHDVVRGDLAIPWWLLAAESGAAILVAGLAAVAMTALHRRRTARPRPVLDRAFLTPLRTVPLALGLVLLTLSTFSVGPAANLSLLGVVAIFAGTPLVLPALLRWAGARMGRLESVPAFLAGRGLAWNPVRAARPFLGVATLIVIALTGVGAIAKGTYAEGAHAISAGSTSVVSVDWTDPHTDDIHRLATTLDAGLIIPMRPPSHHHGQRGSHEDGGSQHDDSSHGHGQAHGHNHAQDHAQTDSWPVESEARVLLLGVTCGELARYFPGYGCGTAASFELPVPLERKVEQATRLGGPDTEIRLAPRHDVAGGGTALVLDDVPLDILDARVRASAMATLPAPYVTSPLGSVTQQSPLIPWIIGGIIAAVLALTAGCLLSLVGRFRDGGKHGRHLLAIGVTPSRYMRLEAWRFTTAYAAAVAGSFAVGFVACLLTVGTDVPTPWRNIGITLATAMLVGAVGLISMVFFGTRRIYRAPD